MVLLETLPELPALMPILYEVPLVHWALTVAVVVVSLEADGLMVPKTMSVVEREQAAVTVALTCMFAVTDHAFAVPSMKQPEMIAVKVFIVFI